MYPALSMLNVTYCLNLCYFYVITGYKVCKNCDSSDGAIAGVPFYHHR